MQLTSRLMFRLLPMQILLAMIGSINNIVSSLFATNFVGADAMAAVGLYSPLSMFVYALSVMLVGGSVILSGKYIGQNEQEKVQNVFNVGNVVSILSAAGYMIFLLVLGVGDMTGFFTTDPAVRPLFNKYLIGQVIGIAPLLLGNQMAAFLSLENKTRRTTFASVVYIVVNVILNYIFVGYLGMEAFGLAIASSIGLWIYFLVQAVYFLSPGSEIKLLSRHLDIKEIGQIIKIGFAGASNYGYMTARGIMLNMLLTAYIGSMGVSAYASSENLLRIVWGLPGGMVAVSRMVMSISIGEEDRQTLTDVMRNMFKWFIPLMAVISAIIMVFAVPITKLLFQDTSDPVYMMTVWGFRIMPICMPISVITMHFICYAQSMGKQVLVQLLSLLDGCIFVVGFTALLMPYMGINGSYISTTLSGIVCFIMVVIYSAILRKRFPRNMDDLLVIPDDFGVSEDERMDISVKKIEDVVKVAASVNAFCSKRGIDERRSYHASLFLEEMAGNIVNHGFNKDKKNHSIDIRVVHKNDDIILRIKDDCVPFNPSDRRKLLESADKTRNIGIRMIYRIADSIEYNNILGLNVLTAHI